MELNSRMNLWFCNGNQWENKIDLLESLCIANFADIEHSFKWGIPIPQVLNDEFLCFWYMWIVWEINNVTNNFLLTGTSFYIPLNFLYQKDAHLNGYKSQLSHSF